jgi:LAGLIDADG DNA endonuclease family
MDDGGRLDYNKGSKNKSLVINTHSFTELEVISICKELENKFSLMTEIRSNKSKKIIVIKSDSYEQFCSLISPYFIPEMKYKLP